MDNFFGEKITVSGLITGRDLIDQLKDVAEGRVYIPINMLRSGEEVFLDDVTLTEVRNYLGLMVEPLKNSGYDLVEALTGEPVERPNSAFFRPYELCDEEFFDYDEEEFIFDPDFE